MSLHTRKGHSPIASPIHATWGTVNYSTPLRVGRAGAEICDSSSNFCNENGCSCECTVHAQADAIRRHTNIKSCYMQESWGPINCYPRLRKTRSAVTSHNVSLSLSHYLYSITAAASWGTLHLKFLRCTHILASTIRLSRAIPSRQQASGCPRTRQALPRARPCQGQTCGDLHWQRPAQICTPSRGRESL